MILLGVTGGIGMGKSTSAAIYARLGFRVVDTDQVARDVVAPGTAGFREVLESFGPSVLGEDGALNRARLAELVFRDAAARARLEAILHPRIRSEWLGRAAAWRREGQRLGVVIIPLLYETAAEKQFDAVVCVACSELSQLARLRGRGWSDEHLARRLASQLPVATKMLRSQFVIWTELSEAAHERQIRCMLRSLGLAGF